MKMSLLTIVSCNAIYTLLQVADSTEVEVMLLRPNTLNYLPEQEKEYLFQDIARTVKDADRPSSLVEIFKKKENNKKWEGFRARLVEEIRKS